MILLLFFYILSWAIVFMIISCPPLIIIVIGILIAIAVMGIDWKYYRVNWKLRKKILSRTIIIFWQNIEKEKRGASNMVKFIICGIILGILLKMLSNVLNNLNHNIRVATIKASEANKYNRKIKEEKRIKEKWINDLRNGKIVNIGIQTIQCKNDIFVIGEKKFSVKEIQKLDFAYDIVNVKKHTQYCEPDSEYRDNLYRRNIEEVSMTYKEYLKKMEEERKYPKYSRENILVYYEFTNKYYILITFDSGKEEMYTLGYSEDRLGKTLQDYSIQEYMVLELRKYINELKITASTTYLWFNDNIKKIIAIINKEVTL